MFNLFGIHLPKLIILLFLVDAGVCFGAANLGLALEPDRSGQTFWSAEALAFMLVVLSACFAVGLHQRQYLRSLAMAMIRLLSALVLAGAVLVPLAYAAGVEHAWASVALALAAAMIGLALVRAGYIGLSEFDPFRRRVLLIGAGENAARIARMAKDNAASNFRCVGCVAQGGEPVLVDPELLTEPHGDLLDLARRLQATQIVLALAPRPNVLAALAPTKPAPSLVAAGHEHEAEAAPELVDWAQAHLPQVSAEELVACRLHGIQVVDYLSFIECETGEVDVDALHMGWLVLSDGFSFDTPWKRGWKRAFDIVVSAAILVVTLPLMVGAALAVLIDDGRPIVYRQNRVTQGGKVFRLAKFRSMARDAERDGVAQWSRPGDPRVTRVGAFLRRTRIDELPQLFNVLKGEMSLIGPRPERPEFVEQLAARIPFYTYRHAVKAGLTGWAQINYDYGSSIEDGRRKLKYDLYYVKNSNPFLDLLIMAQTLRVVFWPPRH